MNCGDGKTAPLVVAADNSYIYKQLLDLILCSSMMNAMAFCSNEPGNRERIGERYVYIL